LSPSQKDQEQHDYNTISKTIVRAYKTALALMPTNILALQGLVSFLQKRVSGLAQNPNENPNGMSVEAMTQTLLTDRLTKRTASMGGRVECDGDYVDAMEAYAERLDALVGEKKEGSNGNVSEIDE
jgi:hypothetical protein